MTLGELIRRLRVQPSGEEFSYPALSRRAGGKPSEPSFDRLGNEPVPEDFGANESVYRTAWGTVAVRKGAVDPESIVGIARALETSHRLPWLALGESLGLVDMFRGETDEAAQKLPPGWTGLSADGMASLRAHAALLIEVERLRARVAELESHE